jgi:predicted DCC family thiol-disulfide oxidoreductase YuxK
MAALRVANPPERPLAVFDGDCGFCRQWVERWRARTGPRVDYAPSQEVAPRFPEIPSEAFARAFQLVLPDGRVLEGAAAVLATLDPTPGDGALSALARAPVLGGLLELAYRLVASHGRRRAS